MYNVIFLPTLLYSFLTLRAQDTIQQITSNRKNAIADILPSYQSIKKIAKAFKVYLREEIPANWHYSKTDDRFDRIGDIFAAPIYPKVLSSWTNRIKPGTHGYDPVMKEMHASFYAWGPQIKKGKTIPSFENIHVYPLVCRLLGLSYTEKIDGDPNVLSRIVRSFID